MSTRVIAGSTALVTGAGQGFGRAIVTALAEAGAQVVGVARDPAPLDELRAELGGSFTAESAEMTDAVAASELIGRYRPGVMVLCAEAPRVSQSFRHQNWRAFSSTWDVDVQHVFHWVRAALLAPLAPGSSVITMSIASALHGLRLSSGYSGAKAAIRWLTSDAADESQREGLGIRFVALLPQLVLATALNTASLTAASDVDTTLHSASLALQLTPDQVGHAVTSLITIPDPDKDGYLLMPAGLRSVVNGVGNPSLSGWFHQAAGETGVPIER